MRKIIGICGLVLALAAIAYAVPIGTHTGQNTAVDSVHWNTYTFNTLPTVTSAPWLASNPNAVGTIITCQDCTATSPAAQGPVLSLPIACKWTGAQWNCNSGPLNPVDFGAKFDWKGFTTGSVTGTAFTDGTALPFVPADVGKKIVVYQAKQGTDWPGAGQPCPHGLEIQPLTNNAGHFAMWAVNRATGTTGGGVPGAFSQTNGGLTTDNTCTWETVTSLTGVPLETTIAAYVSPGAVTLTDAATIALASGGNYIFGTDDTVAWQKTVNSCGSACEITAPCRASAVSEIDIIGRSVHALGCGPGALDGRVNGPLGAGLIALGGGTAPNGGSAFYVQAGFGSWIDGFRIKGISSNPGNGIQWFNGTIPTPTPTPGPNNGPNASTLPNELNRMDNMYFGAAGPYSFEADVAGEFLTAVALTPAVNGANNGPFVFMNNQIGGSTQFELDIPNSQFVNDVFIATQISSSTLLPIAAIRVGAGETTFTSLTVLTGGLSTTTIGDGAFDILNGANVTVNSFAAEQEARLINCDLNGGSTMSAQISFTNGYFQLRGSGITGTATDGNVVNCGTGAHPSAALANLTMKFEKFKWVNAAGNLYPSTVGSWHIDVSNTTNGTAAFTTWSDFMDVGGQAIPFSLANINGNTAGTVNRALVSIKDSVGNDLETSTNGTAAFAQQREVNYPLAAHEATFSLLSPPILDSVCTVSVAGAKICKYGVTVSDSRGESTIGSILACGASAVLGSQNNTLQAYIVPGGTHYNVYADDCNGGALNNLIISVDTPSATIGNTGRSFSFNDNAIARAGAAFPPTVNGTGSAVVGRAPTGLGQILGQGFTQGQSTVANLPSYTNLLTNDGATVLFHFDGAGPNDTAVINARVATGAGTNTFAQTGAITDYAGTAVKPNGTTGMFTVAAGTGLCSTASCSCEMWVKFTSLAGGNQVLLGQKAAGWVFYKAAAASGSYLVLAKQGAGNILDTASSYNFSDSNYHQVGFNLTTAGGVISAANIVVDGVTLPQSNFSTQTIAAADTTMYIASDVGPANFLNATIDEVSCAAGVVWTPAQFAAHNTMAGQTKYGTWLWAINGTVAKPVTAGGGGCEAVYQTPGEWDCPTF